MFFRFYFGASSISSRRSSGLSSQLAPAPRCGAPFVETNAFPAFRNFQNLSNRANFRRVATTNVASIPWKPSLFRPHPERIRQRSSGARRGSSCAANWRPLTPHGRGRPEGLSTVPAFVRIRPIPAENPSVLRGLSLPVKSPRFILSADLLRLVPPAGPARRVRPQTVRDATLKVPLPKMCEIWASRSRRGPNGVRLRARNTFQSSVRD